MGYGPRMRANEPAEGASNSFLWGPQRQIVIRPCPTCEKATLGTVQGACDEVPTDEHFFEPVRYSLVSCTTCGGVSLVSEDLQYEMLDPVRVWPQDQAQPLSPSIPEEIRRELVEARGCFQGGHYTAAAVMVRRVLEGMCSDQGIRPKRLVDQLKELRDANKIEGRLFEWAEGIRIVGNHGAHFNKSAIKREDAEDALAFAEAILDYLYVFTARYEEFLRRRQGA